jgi:3,4-dihydroxy 2-butanone 4-phosphate synthase/GTP cyclohydrolase II
MNDDGTMARLPQLQEFAARHGLKRLSQKGYQPNSTAFLAMRIQALTKPNRFDLYLLRQPLKIGTIADLIHYRRVHESLIERVGERPLHTPWGPFRAIEYRDTVHRAPHLALVRGEPDPATPVPTRVHECHSILDLLDAEPSAHSWPLHAALQRIDAAGCGVAVLLDCDMRSDATRLPASGAHGAAARRDGRVTGIGSQILRDIGVRRLNVLSSPFRLPALSGHDLEIMAFIPLGDADPECKLQHAGSPGRREVPCW